MKLLIALAAAAGLSGCVAYGGGTYGSADVYYGNAYPAYGYGQPYYNGTYRDRDRDGVPNRYDRDRDGDGVPNYRDRRPNNPYR